METPSTDAALTRRNFEDYVFDARTMPWDTLHPVDGSDNQIDISRCTPESTCQPDKDSASAIKPCSSELMRYEYRLQIRSRAQCLYLLVRSGMAGPYPGAARRRLESCPLIM